MHDIYLGDDDFMGKTIDQIVLMAKVGTGRIIAVAGAHDEAVLEAVLDAEAQGLCVPILVGDPRLIEQVSLKIGRFCNHLEVIPAFSEEECASLAVGLIRQGKADFLMKGIISTSVLMKAVIDRENGIRTGRLISHVMLYQVDSYPKIMAVTDGGMIPTPSLDQKCGILENAALLFHLMGYDHINAACICGSEVVNPKIQAMTDAVRIVEMADRWKALGMNVIGPVGLDLAVSKESCLHKNYQAPGCGAADILLVPSYEVGNAFGKGLTYFAGARNAGVVMGASCPIVLVSRADSRDSKLASIALGVVVAAGK